MGALILGWVAVLVLVFVFTSERARENALVALWLLLAGPVLFPFLKPLFGP